MNINVASIQVKDKIISFLWQHFLLVISLYIMTLGVALCVRSSIGSSVISAIPFVMTLAGESGSAPAYTIGEYTYIMNFVLVGLQVLILRRQFQMLDPRMEWFTRVLQYCPGFRRYLFGLARYLYRRGY